MSSTSQDININHEVIACYQLMIPGGYMENIDSSASFAMNHLMWLLVLCMNIVCVRASKSPPAPSFTNADDQNFVSLE